MLMNMPQRNGKGLIETDSEKAERATLEVRSLGASCKLKYAFSHGS